MNVSSHCFKRRLLLPGCNATSRLQTPRSPLAWLHSLKARHGAWDNGRSPQRCGNQGQWNFPCIIKKGLVCSPRPWEVPLVNPTKVHCLRTPRDEGHRRGSANPLLIPSAPLYRYTLSPLTTSRANLRRFGQVNKFSDPWAPQLPSSSSPCSALSVLATGLVTASGLSREFVSPVSNCNNMCNL